MHHVVSGAAATAITTAVEGMALFDETTNNPVMQQVGGNQQQQPQQQQPGVGIIGEDEDGIDDDRQQLPHRVGVMSLEVYEDKLISGGDDSVVRIWNTNNWTCERMLCAHQVVLLVISLIFIMTVFCYCH